MNKFLLLQMLFVASSCVELFTCQHPYPFSQFQLHQLHPTSPTNHFQQYHSTPTPSYVDLDKFNQQAKAFKDHMSYLNQQGQKHVQHSINSVHQHGNEPHFDFIVNANYTDLEKASEQFVSLGSMAAKQNMPKVIKITKTVAVKQPVPMPYAVPIVKVIKEQIPQTQHHFSTPTPSIASVTEKPFESFNFSSYMKQFPTQTQISHSNSVESSHKHAESYIKHEHSTPEPPTVEYDTRPFYVTTSDKEMIKYIPVPYYVDEEGNKHEITSHETSSSDTETLYPNKPHSSSQTVSEGTGKFHSFTFSYHPPTPVHSTTLPTPTFNHHSYAPQMHSTPESKHFYNHDSDNSATSLQQYSSASNVDDGEHYQYKYVTYE